MVAAVNSFTGPWGGPEFGTKVFVYLFDFGWLVGFTTAVVLQGSRTYQAGNSSRQLLFPAARGNKLPSEPLGEAAATREAQFQHRRGYFQRFGRPF